MGAPPWSVLASQDSGFLGVLAPYCRAFSLTQLPFDICLLSWAEALAQGRGAPEVAGVCEVYPLASRGATAPNLLHAASVWPHCLVFATQV